MLAGKVRLLAAAAGVGKLELVGKLDSHAAAAAAAAAEALELEGLEVDSWLPAAPLRRSSAGFA